MSCVIFGALLLPTSSSPLFFSLASSSLLFFLLLLESFSPQQPLFLLLLFSAFKTFFFFFSIQFQNFCDTDCDMKLRRAVTTFRRGLLTRRGGWRSSLSSFCAFELYEFSNTIEKEEKIAREYLKRFGRRPDYLCWNTSNPFVDYATAKVCPAIVYVSREKGIGGSGIIIDSKGMVLTSTDNILPLDARSKINVSQLHRRNFLATILKANKDHGLALLKVDSETPLPSATLGDLEDYEGHSLISIEHPLKRKAYPRPSSQNEVDEEGNLMMSHEEFLPNYEYENFYMSNSGGPIVNLDGEVVGISTQIHIFRQVDEKNSYGSIDGMAIEKALHKVGYV